MNVFLVDLGSGFARELFIKWCSNPKNSIILTQRSFSYTPSSKLIDLLNIRTESALKKEKMGAMEVDTPWGRRWKARNCTITTKICRRLN